MRTGSRPKDLGLKTAREVGDIPRTTMVSPSICAWNISYLPPPIFIAFHRMLMLLDDLPKSTGLEITPGWTNILKRSRCVPMAKDNLRTGGNDWK